MKGFLLVFALLVSFKTQAIETYSANESLTVLTLSGIKLRNSPGGEILFSLPYASSVVTMEGKNSSNTLRIEGISGNWVKVSSDGKIGYVFDGFLSRLPAPTLTEANLKAYVKRVFKVLSDELPLGYVSDNDMGASGSSVLFLEWNKQKFAYNYHFYYEGGGENICLPGVSMEEAYLLMRILERDAFKSALEERSHSDNFDFRPFSEFVLNGISYHFNDDGSISEMNDHYYCDLSAGCTYELVISKMDNFVLINIGGGC